MFSFNGKFHTSLSELPEAAQKCIWQGPFASDLWRMENGGILFLETAYFNLMAQLRQLRVDVPMDFTMESLEDTIRNLATEVPPAAAHLIQLQFYRTDSIQPNHPLSSIAVGISLQPLTHSLLETPQQQQHIELYKDYFIANDASSGILTAQDRYAEWAKIFAYENGYTACLLLNTDKEIISSSHGVLYALQDGVIKTPNTRTTKSNMLSLTFNSWLEKHPDFQFEVVSFSPFELQKLQELSLLSVEAGLQAVSNYRKTNYQAEQLPQLFRDFLKAH